MTAGKPKIYLLDIEGTVAPISLVTEQLFPYARTHLRSFLGRYGESLDVQADLRLLVEENCAETDASSPRFGSETSNVENALAYLHWLMDRDRKSTALKSLQGKIWKAGFESGELKGTLFPDAPEAMRRWVKEAKVAIYSSGSVEAQQLLFRHTRSGDLSPLIANYFDTRTGPKSESASYKAIATKLGVDPVEIIFFSDFVRELNAAREAGCQTRLVFREGNALIDDAQGHAVITALI